MHYLSTVILANPIKNDDYLNIVDEIKMLQIGQRNLTVIPNRLKSASFIVRWEMMRANEELTEFVGLIYGGHITSVLRGVIGMSIDPMWDWSIQSVIW